MNEQENTFEIVIRILVGFILMIGLMVALTIIGLQNMSQIQLEMKEVVEVNSVKITLANTMKNALRNRALSTFSLVTLEDAFLKDEEFMSFNKEGAQYLSARKELERLSKTPKEIKVLEDIRQLTLKTQLVVLSIANDALDDKNKKNITIRLRTVALPLQKSIATEVDKLIELLHLQENNSLISAQDSYKKSRDLMLILGILALLVGVFIAFYILRHVKVKASLLEHQALHDELTGLANRALFQDRLTTAVARSLRQSSSFVLVLIDLDKFKQVNDSLGHHVGDLLLQEVAIRLTKNIRKVDTVARLGGDEFAIIFESLPQTGMVSLLDKLSDSLEQLFSVSGYELNVSVSMGIATFPQHGRDNITLLNRADAAMYEAKRQGMVYICYSELVEKHKLNREKLENVHILPIKGQVSKK